MWAIISRSVLARPQLLFTTKLWPAWGLAGLSIGMVLEFRGLPLHKAIGTTRQRSTTKLRRGNIFLWLFVRSTEISLTCKRQHKCLLNCIRRASNHNLLKIIFWPFNSKSQEWLKLSLCNVIVNCDHSSKTAIFFNEDKRGRNWLPQGHLPCSLACLGPDVYQIFKSPGCTETNAWLCMQQSNVKC